MGGADQTYLRNNNASTSIKRITNGSVIMTRHSYPRNGLSLANEHSLMHHGGHRLDIHGAVLPVDPDGIEAQQRQPSCDFHRSKPSVVAQHGRDLLLMGITDSAARKMRLEEVGANVFLHGDEQDKFVSEEEKGKKET